MIHVFDRSEPEDSFLNPVNGIGTDFKDLSRTLAKINDARSYSRDNLEGVKNELVRNEVRATRLPGYLKHKSFLGNSIQVCSSCANYSGIPRVGS